ncbi:reverse transcriptase-like protein [Halalkalibacterium ligniniphilum]|uniref:reverse transcriptase-like protein n=1 Tax=Halalkalibacterium ligniniphilum TaxID=1134413 RepID=UPI00034DE3B5|nr:reverse transcriptase-like protein [Halalkalibacterium ligniniphilum]
MNLKIEWAYKHPKQQKESLIFTSDFLPLDEALFFVEDIEKTGRVKQVAFFDKAGTHWSKKELLRLQKERETEPHDVIAYFDGGFDKDTLRAGVGNVIYYKQNQKDWRIRENEEIKGISDNNEAEYAALLHLVQRFETLGIHHQDVIIRSDSLVVVKQMSGEWPCYEDTYVPWLERIEKQLQLLGLQPMYEIIDRHDNKEADQLATQALQGKKISSQLDRSS